MEGADHGTNNAQESLRFPHYLTREPDEQRWLRTLCDIIPSIVDERCASSGLNPQNVVFSDAIDVNLPFKHRFREKPMENIGRKRQIEAIRPLL